MLDEREFWQLFAQTGDPLAYVLYRGAAEQSSRKEEACSSTPPSAVS